MLASLAALLASPAIAAATVEPIRIGVIQSQTGTLAISETPLVSAAQLAVDEINAAGGVRGRPLEAVIVDIRSDWDLAAAEAERLIKDEHVVSLFGCWTSACRKAVIPVLQRHRGLLWYPVQYEGRESSPFVIYTGAAPNQQILPAVDWAVQEFGRRVFLVGSDYVFPRTANLIIRERASALGATIVGEHYLELGTTDVRGVVSDIVAAQPDIVINTINGDTNVNFFFELASATSGRRMATLSFSIAENEIRTIGTRLLQGNFVAWNYFQSLDTVENRAFLAKFRQQFGQSAVTSDPIEAAYFQVRAFAEAASDARELTPSAIREAALGVSLTTPGGLVHFDEKSQHTWKTVRLGEIMADGQIQEIRGSVVAVEPKPFAGGRDPAPVLYARGGRSSLTTPAQFMEALADPAQAAGVAVALRELASLPWSTDDRLRAVLAAARSPSFVTRSEAARAAESLQSPRQDVIAVLFGSPDPYDLVAGLRLLGLEDPVNETLATRAAALLAHPSRRVRLAAGAALLAQSTLGWRAGPEATSRVIAGLEDVDLGVQRNAVALAAFSRQIASRILPVLADVDLRSRPEFFRAALCSAMSDVLSDNAAASVKQSGQQAVVALERSVLQIERADCLAANEVTELRAAVARADMAEERGLLYWLRELFQLNFAAGLIATLILVLLSVELVLLLPAIVLLVFSPARLIDTLRRLSRLQRIRVSVEKIGLTLNLFDLLSPTWLKQSRRALTSWVDANVHAYREAFERLGTVRLRQKHVSLPVMVPGRTDAVEPTLEEIRALVRGGRLRLHVAAEGGTGKTSLACVLGRWAMNANKNERIGSASGQRDRGPLIAVLVEPGTVATPTPEGFLSLMQHKLELEGHPEIPLWLVTGLIDHGLLLAIVDDVLEITGIGGGVLGSPELGRLWLIATSRVDLPPEMGEWQIVRPQKLRGMILTEFFVNYAKVSGYADKVGDDDIEAYVTQFKQLLGSESSQETVVFFARLFLDYVFEYVSQPSAEEVAEFGSRRPRSLPELVESFVGYTCRHVAQKHQLAETEVVGLVRRVADLAISEHQQPAPLTLRTLADAADALKKALGIAPDVDLERILVDSGLFERPTAYYLRFKIDLVHEYCAVFNVRDLASAATQVEAYDLWRKWIDRIGTASTGQARASGLLKATYECLRSDRVAGDVPTGLVVRVANLLGIERSDLQPVRIGILYSLQGTMAMSEVALRDAALLAVEEINGGDGIGGRKIEAIVRDGASDPETFAREARRLIRDDGVASIFGCWTSATRKSVKPVVESEHSLLWYPVQYEGYEQSEAIIYGAQRPISMPAVDWCLDTLLPERGLDAGQVRSYLVGSDYVFPRRANAIVRRHLQTIGVEPVCERYLALGSMEFGAIADEIQGARANVVINTINGSSNIGFFRALEERGIDAMGCPVISLSIAEAEVRDIGASRLKGHYAVWNYFQSLPGQANDRFVAAFRKKYGMGRVTSDPIATAYALIKLFAEAARKARTPTREELRRQLALVDIDTPAGRLRFDERTGHFSKYVYIGRINGEGQFDVVSAWNDGRLVIPEPFPYPELAEEFERDRPAEAVADRDVRRG